jgi:fatty acid desaturase
MHHMRKTRIFFVVSRRYRQPRAVVQSKSRIEILPSEKPSTPQSIAVQAEPRLGREGLELPTLGVALTLYGGFLLLTWYFHELPLWVAAPLGSLLLAWYGSFQHETIHGHPTPSRRINTLLASPPLALWIPYARYRDIHLRHHRHGGRYLTDPVHDTESFYQPGGSLSCVGPVRRAIYRANCTLLGRLVLGPALGITGFWVAEIRRMGSGDRRHFYIWVRHAFGAAAVLAWTIGVCRVPASIYVGLIVYPGASLTLLRSFVEHRAHADPHLRTAVVEASPFWGLIFLNNNLHIAHHRQPDLPWYHLPRAWRQLRSSAAGSRAISAGLVFQGGYLEVFRAYLLRPYIPVEHPLERRVRDLAPATERGE